MKQAWTMHPCSVLWRKRSPFGQYNLLSVTAGEVSLARADPTQNYSVLDTASELKAVTGTTRKEESSSVFHRCSCLDAVPNIFSGEAAVFLWGIRVNDFILRSVLLGLKICKPSSKPFRARTRVSHENYLFLKLVWEELSSKWRKGLSWASSHLKPEEPHLHALVLGRAFKVTRIPEELFISNFKAIPKYGKYPILTKIHHKL